MKASHIIIRPNGVASINTIEMAVFDKNEAMLIAGRSWRARSQNDSIEAYTAGGQNSIVLTLAHHKKWFRPQAYTIHVFIDSLIFPKVAI